MKVYLSLFEISKRSKSRPIDHFETMMRVKWILSGDIVDYPASSPETLLNVLRTSHPEHTGGRFCLQWEDLLPDDRELGIAAYVYFDALTVVVSPTIESSAACIHYDWFEWLSTCVNEDLLHHYTQIIEDAERTGQLFDTFFECVTFWCTNPHPIVVQSILAMLDLSTDRPWIAMLSANPADEIVEWLLAHPLILHPSFAARNPHPKLIPYLMEHLTHPRMDDRHLAELPHPEILQHLWDKHQERCLRWMFSNHSPAAIELLTRCVSTRFLPSAHKAVIQKWFEKAESSDESIRTLLNRLPSVFGVPNEQLVDWLLLQDIRTVPHKLFPHLSENPHPKVIEWLSLHNGFRFPWLLSNPHPVAVQLSIQWMEQQERLTPEMVHFLKNNSSLEMALWVTKQYSNTSIWRSSLIGMLAAFPEVRVVWEDSSTSSTSSTSLIVS